MSAKSENYPGTTPSTGTIRIAQVLSAGRGANSGMHLHPQGHRLVTGWCGQSGGLDFWAVDTGQHLQTVQLDVELADVGLQVRPDLMPPGSDADADNWPAHLLPVVDSSMNSLGGHVAVGAGRGIRFYRFSGDETNLVPSQTLRGHEQAVCRVGVDSSGEQAISADPTGQIVVWNTTSAAQTHQLRITTVPHTLSFIWNDMLAMAGDSTGRVICWELARGRRHLQFQAHHGPVLRSAFNESSGVLVTIGADSAARMWNLEEGKQIGSDMLHRSPISDVCFAYAGRFVVTCGLDGHIAVWNSTDGDLLDWYFDSSPVYRIAFDKLNGTLITGSARSLNVLAVDWQRLRELDADVRSSFVVDLSPADHAAMFSQPPPRPQANYQGQNEDAPIGSIMSARQTADLPFPDRSNLAVPRGSAPADRPGVSTGMMPAMPLHGRPASNSTSTGSSNLMPAMPRASGQSSNLMPAMPPASGPSASVDPFGGRTGRPAGNVPLVPSASSGLGGSGMPKPKYIENPLAPSSTPNLEAAMASAQQRQSGVDNRSTSYGIGNSAVHNVSSEANSFFNPVSPDSAVQDAGGAGRVSRLESDLINADLQQPPVSEPLEARVPSRERGRSSVSRLEGALNDKANVSLASSQAFNKRLAAAIACVLLFMVGARSAVHWWYTQKEWPASIAAEVAVVQAAHDTTVAEANVEFEAYEESAEARIRTYRRPNRGRTAEETEILIERIESRLEGKRAERDTVVAEADGVRDAALEELAHARRVSAARLANLSGLSAAVVGLLIAIPAVGRSRSRS